MGEDMNDEMIIEESGSYRVRLEIEQGPVNPREDYDHDTYALTVPHSRYADVAEPGPLVDEWDRIKGRSDAVEIFTRWARNFHGAVVETHTPERGPSSVWYMLPEQIKGVGTAPEDVLRADIAEYQAWAEGDVFLYVIENAVDWKREDGMDGSARTWEEVHTLGTYYGREDAEKEAREAFKEYRRK
jgi:hypothetical protein